jgi:Ca-activated chloride channel homolog
LTRLLLLLLCITPLSQDERYVLSVDVDLVNVSVNVIDAAGIPIQGLAAEDFDVLENGQQQKVSFFSHDAQTPVSIGVLIDTSGSLQDKLQQGLEIVRQVAATLSADDEMFVITFNSHAQLRQPFTSDKENIQRSLLNIRTGGETAVYDALSFGLGEMRSAKNKKRILILLSDCFDTRSKIRADQAEDMLRRSDVRVYAIGLDDDNETNIRKRPRYHIYEYMLAKLTTASGGRLIRIFPNHKYDLTRMAEALIGELRQEYTMAYYPSAVEGSTLRNIEVRVSRAGSRVIGEKVQFEYRQQNASQQ